MSENSGSEADEHKLHELAVLAKVPAMPPEIQNHILSFCHLTSRGALCQLNKEWHAKTTPFLWRHLDFAEAFDEHDVVEATRKFFVACDEMMDDSPKRFATLASYVQTLDVGRLHGINIVRDEDLSEDESDYIYFMDPEGRCVFDVIARFTNLETLSMYMKNWWGYEGLEASGKALARGLKKLTSLKLGGQVSTDVLLGLLDKPQELKHLTLINLIETPGQAHGPNGVAFLLGICDRFSSLETLHLCKLADLDPRLSDDADEPDDEPDDEERHYASGMRWRFPRESEVSVLRDWASLLRHTSSTLRALTLENRYLCCHPFDCKDDFVIDPGNTHPVDYGAFSIRESQRLLFPELLKQEWPQLKKLTLVGMGTIEDVNVAISHLEPRVHVEQRPASIEIMGGDATPEQISTPVEFANSM